MANIQSKALIEKFQYALNIKAGYIWGKTWELWTAAKQTQYARDYANDSNRATSVQYGGKWDGHYVTDCSGLFTWAFNQLGGKMYHGSDTMYKSWCVNKGCLSGGKRSDGKELKPGTAVFTYNESKKNYGHVGLYIGDGWVIEAQGTQAGVVKSKVSLSKWKAWGELKGVDYAATTTEVKQEENKVSTVEIGSAVVNDTKVALRSAPSTSATVLTRVDKGQRVQVLEDNTWTKVNYMGKTGYMMTKFLDK